MKITVFTPTYNRAETLPRLYESLVEQKKYLNEWVLVDDGSEDDTEHRVREWCIAEEIKINYIKKPNGGLISAHNVAYDNIADGPCVCIDSDDFLAPQSLEIISREISKIYDNEKYSGIVGLDVDQHGNIIGDNFPSGIEELTFKELRFYHKIKGDKKYVFKKSVIDEVGRYPEIDGEKYPAVSYLYRLIDRKYRFKVVRHPLCVVEYRDDGISKNKVSQYLNNPLAFKHYRLFCMDDAYNFKEKMISSIHFVSSCIVSKTYKDIFFNRHALLTIPLLPFGYLLSIYLNKTRKRSFFKG